MTHSVEQLVRETIDLTGAEPPDLMAVDFPVLGGDALRSDEDGGFYLVGLIGGKDVGKSALVNALAGGNVTRITSYGPGTETVIAYAHSSQEPALRELLVREVPGKYRIVTHEVPTLRRQVLLDLPDIDSHYQSHLTVTRTMLRHMLYPIWVQSVEKYADLQPQQMLAKVAAGNALQNFLFCLNKADQLDAGKDRAAAAGDSPASADAQELCGDFAARIARTLSMEGPPEIFLISAKYPDRYDLPRLRQLLSRQKSEQTVRDSKALAGRRQDQSMLDWLAGQKLEERAARIGRLRQDAEELTAERLAVPLVERVAPRLADDPANRQALADDILTERIARWPLVSLVHTLLSPLFVLARTMGARHGTTLQGADAMADFYLQSDGWAAAAAVQTVFAHLRQSHPALAVLYEHNRLWDQLPAEQAAGDLSRRLAGAVERQRTSARDKLAGRRGVVAPLVRWTLTIGALLWFPFIQPVLQAVLKHDVDGRNWEQVVGLIVQVLGVNYLLTSSGFLAIYFAVLWLALRWNTQRKVARMLGRWRLADDPDPNLNLAAQALQWVDDLTGPIRASHERTDELADRAAKLRAEFTRAA